MTPIPQIGTYFELDPIIGWRGETVGLSPVNPSGVVANCAGGQPVVTTVSTGSTVDCVTGQPVIAPSSPATCCAAAATYVTPVNVSGAIGLQVDCVTGQPLPFLPALAGQLRYPVALVRGDCDRKLYVLDRGVGRVKALDLAELREFSAIAGFGGKGTQPRQLRGPRGLAVLPDGSYVVADTGNHQVKIFSGYPNALLAVWGTGEAGSGPGEFNLPWKVVADRCGLIYITDKGNGRVQRIRRNGTADEPILGLQAPTGLAIAPDGTLAVVDGANVLVYASGRTEATEILSVVSASCVTFDDSGCYLYVGTSTALVYKFEAADTGFRYVGIGVTGVTGQLLDLLWTPQEQLLGILLPHCAVHPTLVTIPTCGTYVGSGTLSTQVLDSGIDNCVWDRIRLKASLPQGTLIQVTAQTSNCDPATNSLGLAAPLTLTGDDPDCLVQSLPGRYLQLQVTLKSNVVASPILHAIRISFPRSSYLQYLPAVYQQDDQSRVFLDRFLRIFQTTFDQMDSTLDTMWMRFDPLSVPSSWFSWLAAWIALPINPVWTDAQRRTALKTAGQLYPQRGTPAGVQQLVEQYSGVNVRLVEHYRLRQLTILDDSPDTNFLGLGTRLWSRDYYQRLQLGVYSRVGYFDLTGEPEPDIEPIAWGANQFTVFFDCNPYQVSTTQQNVSQAVEREKPAYTQANYAPVFPRMRVGVQCTLGVDTRIGEYTPLLLGTTGTLDYDSILSCSKTETHLLAQGATLRPQVDINTRLL